MSSTNLEKGQQAHAGMQQQFLRNTSTPLNPAFPPQYEARVNENMRNLSRLEGQIGAGAFAQGDNPKQNVKQQMWKRCAVFAALVLLIVGGVALGIALTTHSKQCKVTAATPSRAGNAREAGVSSVSELDSSASTVATVSTTTVTALSVNTVVSTLAILETTTATAAIPASIAAAASSFYSAWSSSIAEEVASISAQLEPSSVFLSAPSTEETTYAFQTSTAPTTLHLTSLQAAASGK